MQQHGAQPGSASASRAYEMIGFSFGWMTWDREKPTTAISSPSSMGTGAPTETAATSEDKEINIILQRDSEDLQPTRKNERTTANFMLD